MLIDQLPSEVLQKIYGQMLATNSKEEGTAIFKSGEVCKRFLQDLKQLRQDNRQTLEAYPSVKPIYEETMRKFGALPKRAVQQNFSSSLASVSFGPGQIVIKVKGKRPEIKDDTLILFEKRPKEWRVAYLADRNMVQLNLQMYELFTQEHEASVTHPNSSICCPNCLRIPECLVSQWLPYIQRIIRDEDPYYTLKS